VTRTLDRIVITLELALGRIAYWHCWWHAL